MLTFQGFPLRIRKTRQLLESALEEVKGNLELVDFGLVCLERDRFLDQLQAYRCAVLERPSLSELSQIPVPQAPFTMGTINKCIFPDHRMYTVIDSLVFDIASRPPATGVRLRLTPSELVHTHPGGQGSIFAWAGRDATEEFKAAHDNWEELLGRMPMVGRAVPYHNSAKPLARDEIKLGG